MRKRYDEEFKKDTLRQRRDHPELSVSAVCRKLDISEPTYYKWLKKYREANGENVSNEALRPLDQKDQEIIRLRKELEAERAALEILKKSDPLDNACIESNML